MRTLLVLVGALMMYVGAVVFAFPGTAGGPAVALNVAIGFLAIGALVVLTAVSFWPRRSVTLDC